MSTVYKSQNNRPCSTCGNNHANRCGKFSSDVTGEAADIHAARAECRGIDWEQRFNISAVAQGASITATDDKGNVYTPDQITTPDGTIVHRNPPPKLYE